MRRFLDQPLTVGDALIFAVCYLIGRVLAGVVF